jgi:hypothetical protein
MGTDSSEEQSNIRPGVRVVGVPNGAPQMTVKGPTREQQAYMGTLATGLGQKIIEKENPAPDLKPNLYDRKNKARIADVKRSSKKLGEEYETKQQRESEQMRAAIEEEDKFRKDLKKQQDEKRQQELRKEYGISSKPNIFQNR